MERAGSGDRLTEKVRSIRTRWQRAWLRREAVRLRDMAPGAKGPRDPGDTGYNYHRTKTMKNVTVDDLRKGLLELERRSDEMKERFPEEYARIYASEQNPPEKTDI